VLTLAPTVSICVQPLVPSGDCSILNPSSSLLLSVHDTLIWACETGVAVRLLGSAGASAWTVAGSTSKTTPNSKELKAKPGRSRLKVFLSIIVLILSCFPLAAMP